MEKKYIDMGSVGMHPKGAYDASVTYCKLQLVTHGGNTYLSKTDGNIGHEPVGEDEWWSLIVDAKSAHDGAQSAQEAAEAANAAAKTANDKAAEAAKAAESVTDATAGLKEAMDGAADATAAANGAASTAQAQASRAQEAAEQGESLNLQLTDTLRKAKAEVDKAEVFNNTATANEQERVKAEHERAEAETQRTEAETQRASNETNRTEAENTRGNDEKLRAEAEARRVANEKLRVVTDRNGESKSVKVGEGEKVNQLVTDMKETKEAVAQNAAEIAELKENVKDYYVGENDEVTGDPHFKNCKGNKEFLGDWHPYLIDHTDNTGEATHPVGQLMDNNHFRFATGAFAPTVGITEEMRAACDVQLYTDAEHTTPLTLKNGVVVTDKAGAHPYDATEVYNSLGLVDLYDGEGNKVRQLLPWETTETKYSVMIGRYDTLYPVDRQTGESGKVLSGVFKRPMKYDGINTGKYPLLGTAQSPCLVTTVGNKTRSFFFAYAVGDANTASGVSSAGADMCSMFDGEDRTYPRYSISQITDMQYARANNADVNAPVPFAEGGYHAINTFTLCMELLYGTKFLHDNDMFGSGISSNDPCASADDWMYNGGVRVREKGTTDWTYKKWGDQTPFGVKSDMSKVGFSNFVNQEKPKEQCMESQMAASWAVEFGIAEDTEYEAYGQTYRYRNVTGVKGLADGVMSCNVYRIKAGTCMGYKAADSKVEYDCELCLRLSLVHGMNLSGDVFGYWGGGMEMVGTGKQQENTIQDKIKNAYIDFYLEPKQKNWLMEKNTTLSDFKTFAFEGVYAKIGTFGPPILASGYFKKRMGLTPYKTENGGNIDSYQCCYGWTEPYWLDRYGQRVRIAVRLRGIASTANCSPRALHAAHSAAITRVTDGGSAQCRIVQ